MSDFLLIYNSNFILCTDRARICFKFGNGHRKMKIGSQPHTFREYKTQDGPWISKECSPYRLETQGIFNNTSSQVNTSPKIDLFVTRLNTQLGTFVSYRPDPKCIVVNAFLLDWSKLVFYAFPHLSVRIESYRKYTKTRQKVLSLPQAGHLSLSTQA